MRRLLAIAVLVAFCIACSAASASQSGLPSIYGPNAGPLIEHHGGRVQRNPVVHLVFWGSGWARDTTGIVAAEQTLFRQLAGSAYNAILGQYGVHNDVREARSFFDAALPSGKLTLDDLAREAAKLSRRTHRQSGPDVQWIILPHSGADMHAFNNECGEHDRLVYHGHAYYVDLIPPFQDPLYTSPCVYDYSTDDGTRPPGDLLDATTSITSHEYAEAATDPFAATGERAGWTIASDGTVEVGDLCAWYSGAAPGLSVNVSYLWSNVAKGCVLSGS